jgi:hypothetical protein
MPFRIPFPLLLVLPFLLLIFITLRSPSPSHVSPTNSKVVVRSQKGPLVNQASTGQQTFGSPSEEGDAVLKTRIVAVGDIHADLPRLMKVLRRAEIVDLKGYWIGGETILVQTGGTSFFSCSSSFPRSFQARQTSSTVDRIRLPSTASSTLFVRKLKRPEVLSCRAFPPFLSISSGNIAHVASPPQSAGQPRDHERSRRLAICRSCRRSKLWWRTQPP